MNVEKNRLETFIGNWPSESEVNPQRIAKAGFYYTYQNLTVQCFCCGIQISEWNYGDQVMAKHKALSPSCPFVLNPSTSGNVPMIISSTTTNVPSSTMASSSSKADPGSPQLEDIRLATFEKWPKAHIIAPKLLAHAGFFYLKQNDMTKCHYCNGIVKDWEPGDNPDKEHVRLFPNCSFVKNIIKPRLANIPQDNVYANLTVFSNSCNLQDLGVQNHKEPKRSQYKTLESRLRTFDTWPEQIIQRPHTLAEAGFFYEGISDQVRCFHCDGGLRDWNPEDDPWTEHAKWFPTCAFIKIVKGQPFVINCSSKIDRNKELLTILKKNTEIPGISNKTLASHMDSAAAKGALQIGIEPDRVQLAIRQKLQSTGTGFSNVDSLIEAALNLPETPGTSNTPAQDSLNRLQCTMSQILTTLDKNSGDNELAVTESEVPLPTNKGDTSDKTDSANLGASTLESLLTEVPRSLEEENRALKEARLCKICMDADVGIVFLPCGHLATCIKCAPNLGACPVCRSAIEATVRTFLS